MAHQDSRRWPAVLAFLVLLALVATLGVASARSNEGHFVFALDDAYISMAVAKNLARHGVWGVSEEGFSSSASSLMWPLLLAGTYVLFGVNAWSPLVLNLIFAAGLLRLLDTVFQGRGLGPPARSTALLAVVVLTPLPTLMLVGLEHTLHALLAVALVLAAGRALNEKAAGRAVGLPWMSILAALLVATRYEGLALVGMVALVLLARGTWRSAAAVTAAGTLPVILYGGVSLAMGWEVLPNPIFLKSWLGSLMASLWSGRLHGEALWRGLADLAGHAAYRELLLAPELLFLLMFCLALLAFRLQTGRPFRDPANLALLLFAGQTLLHVQFARVGWFYRYEAYLVVLGIFAATAALAEGGARSDPSGAPRFDRRAALPLCLLAALPAIALAQRCAGALIRVPLASSNIYDLQYHMGLFVRENYQHGRVVAIDIGALNYLADIHCLDLAGLGSLEPARLWMDGRLDRDAVERLARGASIALVYPGFLDQHGGPPASWVEVGRWSIPRTVMMGDSLAIYAVDPREAGALTDRLRAFSARLPARVQQSGPYLGTAGMAGAVEDFRRSWPGPRPGR